MVLEENPLACSCVARGRCCVCDGKGRHHADGHWYCYPCRVNPEGDSLFEPSLEELREKEFAEEESA